jgi:hypothetical protein
MRIYIDYNAETADGRFFARLARLDERVELGRVVQTHDDDGNGLVMTVDEIDEDNRLVYLRPDWSTWVDGDSPRTPTPARGPTSSPPAGASRPSTRSTSSRSPTV